MIDLRLTGFYPSLLVPVESAPAATLAFLYLLLAIFTLTLKRSFWVVSTRFLLSAASCYWFWKFGFRHEVPNRTVESGMAIICGYGIFRNIETSFGYLLEPLPRWVQHGVAQKIPNTFIWRVIWSLDLLFSMRGTSYLPKTHWDFAPRSLIAPKHDKSRIHFLRDQTISLLGQIILMDFFDTTIKARSWPTMVQAAHPLTTLHFHYQLHYAFSLCITTALAISIPYTSLSMVAVLVGCPTAGWPPLFDDPFHANSLQAFWTHKWHASFRRVFLMVSAAIVDASKRWIPNGRARSAFRGLCVFLSSCILHLILMYRIRPVGFSAKDMSFFEAETMLFFLLQPCGMLIEVLVVREVAASVFGKESHKVGLCTRVWAWIWLLWTGRYWTEVWIRHGLWRPEERVVGYSIFRGVLYGEWKQ